MKNKHAAALVTKFLLYGPIMAFILPFFAKLQPFEGVLLAMILVPLSYLVIDLQLLPGYNVVAIVCEAVLAALMVVGGVSILTGDMPNYAGPVVVALLVASGEWYFHTYLSRTVFNRGRYHQRKR